MLENIWKTNFLSQPAKQKNWPINKFNFFSIQNSFFLPLSAAQWLNHFLVLRCAYEVTALEDMCLINVFPD